MITNQTDLRPALARGQQRVDSLINTVTADQLALETPCPELDVRSLIRHLIAGTTRVQVMADGGDATTVPFIVQVDDDQLGSTYQDVMIASQQAWQRHDDLSIIVRAPWGEVPAAAAIGSYLTEVLAHGWDLAVATGQPAEIDTELAVIAESVAQKAIPVERGEGIPFGPVVESAADATATERFVHWMGRDASAWSVPAGPQSAAPRS